MAEAKEKSDSELIGLAKENPESFGLLMERYQGPLFHYVRRLTQGTHEEIEDLLQEIFIKIYQHLNEYESSLKFSSWAYRVAHNHVVDHFRKISARPKADALEEKEWETLIRASIDPEKDFSNRDCLDRIKECLEDLPLQYKEILILRFLEEKSYDEIMDILKKPKGSVATLIARGRGKLLDKMREKNINCF